MIAALFPGQGSQHVGMGKTLYDEFRIARETFEEASDSLGTDLAKLCFEGPDTALALTENTQPCLLLVSYATFRVLKEVSSFAPAMAAGHSLGEYSALVSAGSLDFSAALKAVRARGRFMQEAVPVGKGGMAAVLGLEDDEVRKVCLWAEKEFATTPVEPANFNAPGQVVISGDKSLIEKLIGSFDPEKVLGVKKRAKFIPLNVSAPFHCSMMKPAEEKMKAVLDAMDVKAPAFAVVQNVSALEESDPAALREKLVRQISSPVLWTQSVKRLKEQGITKVLECGPGKVLAGLVKKIDSGILSFNVQTLEDIRLLEKERSPWLT